MAGKNTALHGLHPSKAGWVRPLVIDAKAEQALARAAQALGRDFTLQERNRILETVQYHRGFMDVPRPSAQDVKRTLGAIRKAAATDTAKLHDDADPHTSMLIDDALRYQRASDPPTGEEIRRAADHALARFHAGPGGRPPKRGVFFAGAVARLWGELDGREGNEESDADGDVVSYRTRFAQALFLVGGLDLGIHATGALLNDAR